MEPEIFGGIFENHPEKFGGIFLENVPYEKQPARSAENFRENVLKVAKKWSKWSKMHGLGLFFLQNALFLLLPTVSHHLAPKAPKKNFRVFGAPKNFLKSPEKFGGIR